MVCVSLFYIVVRLSDKIKDSQVNLNFREILNITFSMSHEVFAIFVPEGPCLFETKI